MCASSLASSCLSGEFAASGGGGSENAGCGIERGGGFSIYMDDTRGIEFCEKWCEERKQWDDRDVFFLQQRREGGRV